MTEHDVGERLVAIETELKLMNQQWKEHTEQDKDHYDEILEKVTALQIDKALRTGEDRGMRRVAGWVSFCVATLISAVALALNHMMGGS